MDQLACYPLAAVSLLSAAHGLLADAKEANGFSARLHLASGAKSPRPHRLPLLPLVIASLSLIVAAPAFADTEYSIIDLGDLGGGYARARAINEQGQIAGEALLPGTGIVDRAVLWQTGGVTDLGTLGGQQSSAFAINSSGTIAGWAQNAAGNSLPTLWNGATATPLATLGGTGGRAWGLNDAGVAVGQSYLSSGAYRATLWSAGSVRDLGTLGGSYSVAYDINNRGVAVGTASDSLGKDRAVLWAEGGPIDLGSLTGGIWTAGWAINDLGQVILWGTPTGATANHAAFWNGDPSTSVLDLGTFGGNQSWAWGLNDNGFVVGWAEEPDSTYHAFVWDGTGTHDLGTLGGFYSSAYGINDQGVIVGYANDALGNTHAVEWIPVPEPSGVVLFLLGAATVILRKRPQ